MFKQTAMLAGALMLASCVTTKLTERGEQVRVTTNNEVVRGCKYIGEVKASDRMNGGAFGQDAAEENTDRRIKNAAAEKGADTVLLSRADKSGLGASARGEAYFCGKQ